jgi:hypothetical protein
MSKHELAGVDEGILLQIIDDYEVENASLKKKLNIAITEYKRMHSIACEGFEYYDDKSEEFLATIGAGDE